MYDRPRFHRLTRLAAVLGVVGLLADFGIALIYPSLTLVPQQIPMLAACIVLTLLLLLLGALLLPQCRPMETVLKSHLRAFLVILVLQLITYAMMLSVAAGIVSPESLVAAIVKEDFLLFDFLGFLDAVSLPFTVNKYAH